MKTELIETIDLNEEFEKYFFTTKDTHKVKRRDFLKFCTIGSAGIIFPLTIPVEATANPLLLSLIRVAISALVPAALTYSSNTNTSGDIYLVNDKSIHVNGNLNLALIDEWSLDEFSSRQANYTVPANKVQRYRFTNGPSARVKKETKTYLYAKTRIDEKRSETITIKA